MITITPISAATLDNAFVSNRNNATIPKSSWMGEASAYFRLEGPVRRQPLVSLFKGSTPDGKVPFFSGAMVEAAPDGWLIQFTAPPTVQTSVKRPLEGKKASKSKSLGIVVKAV